MWPTHRHGGRDAFPGEEMRPGSHLARAVEATCVASHALLAHSLADTREPRGVLSYAPLSGSDHLNGSSLDLSRALLGSFSPLRRFLQSGFGVRQSRRDSP